MIVDEESGDPREAERTFGETFEETFVFEITWGVLVRWGEETLSGENLLLSLERDR